MSTSIMVVEDEAIVGLEIADVMQRFGYSVPIVAMSGEEALRRMTDTEIDVVIMDINLGEGIDGIDTANAIQNALQIPVVFLTAYSDDGTIRRATEADSAVYLVKPFDPRELHAVVQTSLASFTKRRENTRQRGWLLSIIKSLTDGLIITNMKGSIVYMNPSAENLLEWDYADARGQMLFKVFKTVNKGDDSANAVSLSPTILENKTTEYENVTIIDRKRVRFIARCSVTPLRNKVGSNTGAIVLFSPTPEDE